MWNLTVCSLMWSSRAIILFENPCPSRPSTSRSRAVGGSESSSATAGSANSCSARAFGSTVRPCAAAATAAPSSSVGASGGTMPHPLSERSRSLDADPSSSESSTSDCVPSSATASAVSSSDSSSATSKTSASENEGSGTGPAGEPASPTTLTPAASSIERSPARPIGVGPTTNTPADGLQQRLDVRERLIRGADQHVADQKAGPVGRTVPFDGGDHEPRTFDPLAAHRGRQLHRQHPNAQAGGRPTGPGHPGAHP